MRPILLIHALRDNINPSTVPLAVAAVVLFEPVAL